MMGKFTLTDPVCTDPVRDLPISGMTGQVATNSIFAGVKMLSLPTPQNSLENFSSLLLVWTIRRWVARMQATEKPTYRLQMNATFSLPVELPRLQLFFALFLQLELFYLHSETRSSLVYSGNLCLRSSSADCKQRSSTVSTKTPTITKKTSPIALGTIRHVLGNEKSAQNYLAQSSSKSGTSRPKSRDIPATPCLK